MRGLILLDIVEGPDPRLLVVDLPLVLSDRELSCGIRCCCRVCGRTALRPRLGLHLIVSIQAARVSVACKGTCMHS